MMGGNLVEVEVPPTYDYAINDVVDVIFDGNINDAYPLQISTPITIQISPNE
jgi:hypothetical protein